MPSYLYSNSHYKGTQIARFMGPTWVPPGSCQTKMIPCWSHEPCYQGETASIQDHLTFITGIPIVGKMVFILKQAPDCIIHEMHCVLRLAESCGCWCWCAVLTCAVRLFQGVQSFPRTSCTPPNPCNPTVAPQVRDNGSGHVRQLCAAMLHAKRCRLWGLPMHGIAGRRMEGRRSWHGAFASPINLPAPTPIT